MRSAQALQAGPGPLSGYQMDRLRGVVKDIVKQGESTLSKGEKEVEGAAVSAAMEVRPR